VFGESRLTRRDDGDEDESGGAEERGVVAEAGREPEKAAEVTLT
jgi:hypothetical protein